MNYPSRFDPAIVEEIAAGLATFAQSHPDRRLRTAAAAYLLSLGDGRKLPEDQWPAALDEIERVYDNSKDASVRWLIVTGVHRQGDRSAAVRFLTKVAKEDRAEEGGGENPGSYLAVRGLLLSGAEGQSALRRLHADGSVTDGVARAYLDEVATQGFRDPQAAGPFQLRAAVQRIDITYRETFPIPVQLPNGDPAPEGLRSTEWSSLDPSVASVSAEGTVTGIGWGQAAVVLADSGVPTDTVIVSVMPSGAYRFWGTLVDESGRANPGRIAGTIHFAATTDGLLATVEDCDSRVITGADPFSFDCGATLTFALTPPFGISGVAYQSISGTMPGPRRTEIVRVCARLDPATGRCVQYRRERRERRSDPIPWSTTRIGDLVVQKAP